MSRENLFSIAPDAPFLPTLVDAVLSGRLFPDWPRDNPFWLTDITIVLPTKRSRAALAEAFLARGQRLLPDLRIFGGEAVDEEPFLPPLDAPLPLPAVSLNERRLVLARLVDAWSKTPVGQEGFSHPPHAGEILAMADALGELLDDIAIEGVSVEDLRAIAPESLAIKWQATLRFLEIALSNWPEVLTGRGKGEGTVLRNERLRRQAAMAPLLYGDRPVIAAGTTGSIPATAELLAAILDLPRGVVVLPGLDVTLDAETHIRLLDVEETPHGHPQYGLAKLLRKLESGFASVIELPEGPRPARTRLVRHALALSRATSGWRAARAAFSDAELSEATQGMTILAARTEDEEARAIALAARDALGRSQTVGIVTPDQTLARRIAAELRRFEVEVEDTAGTPLFQSPAGRLLRSILALVLNRCAPVDIMALLHNRACRFGLSRAEVARRARWLDLGVLRGQRSAPGLAGLRDTIEANRSGRTERVHYRLNDKQAERLNDLLTRMDRALAPLAETVLSGRMLSAHSFAAALLQTLDAVTQGTIREPTELPPGAEELEAWAADLAERPDDGPAFHPIALDGLLAALMRGFEVRSKVPGRTDIAIWGQLEARLQSPDLMILAGLNEDIWPAIADPGPWLSRGMRLAAGLEPPERRQGQAAHDFEMALGNAQVLLCFSERIEGAPAAASRLLQRLEAFLGEEAKALRAKGERWREEARRIDMAETMVPAGRPMPCPPAALRPRKLSITEVEALFRSPYDLYARHTLRLRPLEALGEDLGARERGTLIHSIFARFIDEGHELTSEEANQILSRLAEEAFAALDAIGERRDIWLKRFEAAAMAFLEFERARHASIAKRHAEISGAWSFPELDNFTLSGRADRIDLMADGRLHLIDFKTGGVPAPKDMQAFEAPQLLLEAAMARQGLFEAVPKGEPVELTYVKIGLGPEAFVPKSFSLPKEMDLVAASEEAVRRLRRQVEVLLLRDDLPMAAHIRPAPDRRYAGAYDHLARRDEWSLNSGEGEA